MNLIRLPVQDRPTATVYRDVHELANKHGFESVQSLAHNIPTGEAVIDIGSSLSRLGHAVTALRADITWVNFDVAYGNQDVDDDFNRTLRRLQASSPQNLHYIAGNILRPPEELRARSFGRVLSYWMLPHIVQHNHKEGLVAASNMITLGKVHGILTTGPMRTPNDNSESFEIPESLEDVIGLSVKITDPWVGQE